LRVVPNESYGAALHYFTGSKDHNVVIRKRGIERGLKINEYGVFKGEELTAGEKEEEVFEAVGLPIIQPELRENRGEVEAAEGNALPKLVEHSDIKGDLQTHSKYSDGAFTIREMAEAAIELGYDYIAITDHSKRVSVANGMDEKRLAEQIEEIESVQKEFSDFRIIKSAEVDILVDGTLDLSDDILKELDMVLCSIHYNRNLSLEKQTERVLRAMDNPYFNVFAHPTGRLIGSREPYRIDLYKIMEAAKEHGCFLEINAHPERLDLNDADAKMAKEMGLKIPISTDSHTKDNLNNMRFGIMQARRGWLEKEDVLNTRPWKELSKLFKR
jgi:DNA polymerase (family 10)